MFLPFLSIFAACQRTSAGMVRLRRFKRPSALEAFPAGSKPSGKNMNKNPAKAGRGEYRSRTDDLLRARQAL